ncbi:pyridoxal-phosphate dependent enzyme [Thermophagus xiamenensis]|uniref:Threonine dehydratase n=1 Tax=Thermophagus xiamenensis TaxID=385682 RepID=A0A1I2CHS7_9BACT|nr:pyridoxal-phosphate dependent enzyme [Thermophagus xiamenensis]SFE67881.1 threonine dehydratase [Thermophagus xiamenensis]
MSTIITFREIQQAYQRIHPFINRTPVVTNASLNTLLETTIYFKCENRQKCGVFKFRGATNAVQSLTPEQAKNGVATHSSGNHAAALAMAAMQRNIPAYIVMPRDAPKTKVENVERHGGKITFCEPTLQAREEELKKVVEKTDATFIHPYDCAEVICGQGTATMEMIEDYGSFDIIMTPVGGGGLLSGTALAAKSMLRNVQVIAGEPANADDAFRSLNAGHIIPSQNPDTIADGLKTSLGKLNFQIINQFVDKIITVSEEAIRKAMVLLQQHTGMLAEPSSAVPLAAIMENKEIFKNKKIGLILSGGNITKETFDSLTKAGD